MFEAALAQVVQVDLIVQVVYLWRQVSAVDNVILDASG